MALPGLVADENLKDIGDQEKAWDNLGSNISSGDIALPSPSLDLNFATNKSLIDSVSGNNLISFSRASTGTFVGSNGLIQTAASGVPRFDHDPLTNESRGLLVEQSSTNHIRNSENLSNWTKGGTQQVIIANNVGLAPDGANTADMMIPSVTVANQSIYQSSPSLPSGAHYVTFYAKPAGYNYIAFGDLSNYYGVTFTLIGGGSSRVVVNAVRVFSHRITRLPSGWYKCEINGTRDAGGSPLDTFTVVANDQQGVFTSIGGDGVSGVLLWGIQIESGSIPTSYIPTAGATVTRAADIATISGANFSSWHNQNEGSLIAQISTPNVFTTGTSADYLQIGNSSDVNTGLRIYRNVNGNVYGQNFYAGVATVFKFTPISQASNRYALSYTVATKQHQFAYNQTIPTYREGATINTSAANVLAIGGPSQGSGSIRSGIISRVIYWPKSFNDTALTYISNSSLNTFGFYNTSYQIKGRDVLALEGVRNTSTRDFIFIKGLASAVQPRLTTAAQNTLSGTTLRDNALLKTAATSSGNYFFSSGVTLSGVSIRINGTNALSIATSPFSGSTATSPLLISELRPQTNWQIAEPMTSGVISSPDLAIPYETNDFVMFIEAGQN